IIIVNYDEADAGQTRFPGGKGPESVTLDKFMYTVDVGDVYSFRSPPSTLSD
ncbi:hypothetical protein PAXRUDRAFT_141701, partial [Paxillus rubicundulus Ve08.2h10]